MTTYRRKNAAIAKVYELGDEDGWYSHDNTIVGMPRDVVNPETKQPERIPAIPCPDAARFVPALLRIVGTRVDLLTTINPGDYIVVEDGQRSVISAEKFAELFVADA